MRKILSYGISILAGFLSQATIAQTLPQLYSSEPIFSHQYKFLNQDYYYFIDTTFNSLDNYHQWNNAQKDLFEYSELGNMGAALNPLTFQKENSIWNYGSAKAFEPYFHTKSKVPFYYVRSPLTQANYWMGYERGQSFSIYHTQNINKNWNFLVRFKRLNTLGLYAHSQNKETDFLLSTHYNSPETGYELYSYFSAEKMDIEENGGLQDINDFINNVQESRVLLNVNLLNDRRILRQREVFLDHKIKINELFDRTDSVIQHKQSENYFALGHSFLYNRIIDTYRGNATSAYYDNYFFSDGEYSDSNAYNGISNYLYLQGSIGDTTQLEVKAGIKNLLTSYGNNLYHFPTNNLGLSGSLKGDLTDRAKIRAQVDYIFTGNLNQSFSIEGNAELKLWKEIYAVGDYSLQYQYPDFYEQYYISNNYIWQNNFERSLSSILEYGLSWSKENHLKIAHFNSLNYIYYDSTATPKQSGNPVNVFRISLQQNFKFWDLLFSDNKVYFQTTTDAEEVLPLPKLVSRNSLYFKFSIFKDALICLIGGEMKYFSSYNSPSYNPAVGEFYNARERTIGNYPLIDVFANFKIKKAIVFVKLEHFNAGLMDFTYFASPRFPFPDRTLRVGIQWRFFN